MRRMGCRACVPGKQTKVRGLFGRSVQDLKPRPFDYRDVCQKFKIIRSSNRTFHPQSAAPNGFPLEYLRKKSWEIRTSHFYQSKLKEALSLEASLQACLPDFSFPISDKCSDQVIVGKWYCPFVFFMEDGERRHQMKRSTLYNMVLKQRWEKIYMCEGDGYETNDVTVNLNVQKDDVFLFSMKAKKDDMSGLGGLVWFWVLRTVERTWRGIRWAISTAVFEKMKWIQKVVGYIYDNDGAVVDIERGMGLKGFCCYVLAELFMLTRLDGSTVMTY